MAPSPPAIETAAAATVAPTGTSFAPSAKPATDPIQPIHVKTVKVKMAPTQVATLAAPPAAPAPVQAAAQDALRDHTPPAATGPHVAVAQEPKREAQRDLIAEVIRESAQSQSTAPRHTATPAPSPHSGWIIQVGAFDVEREARERLSAVQAKAGQILKRASPFTEAVVTGDKTLYRARFAGIQKDQAEAICRQLKRNDIVCMTIKN